MLHKFNSPAWLKHIQKANAALGGLTPDKLAALGSGEAYVWSRRSTDDAFIRGAVKVRYRPRVTRHGGGTKTAVGLPAMKSEVPVRRGAPCRATDRGHPTGSATSETQ